MRTGPVDRAVAAQRMVAQDARWIGDAFLSTENYPKSSGAVALALVGHSSRIVFEGGRFIRSAEANPDLRSLAEQLPDEFALVIQRARHASKLLDDNRKTVLDLASEMDGWLALHRSEFLGDARRLGRFRETDIGLFRVERRLLLATVPVQFRLGLDPGTPFRVLSRLVRSVAVEHGMSLSILCEVGGDTTPPTPMQDYSSLGRLPGVDRRAARYVAHRYDEQLPNAVRLLLLLVEGEITTAERLLPLTTSGHEEAVFRARFVSVFHALSAIHLVLSTYPTTDSTPTSRVRALLDSEGPRWILSDRGARKLRNQCVHYAVRSAGLRLDQSEPMLGLVRDLTGLSFQDVATLTTRTATDLSNAVSNWHC